MGVSKGSLCFLCHCQGSGVNFENVVTLGRQRANLTLHEALRIWGKTEKLLSYEASQNSSRIQDYRNEQRGFYENTMDTRCD